MFETTEMDKRSSIRASAALKQASSDRNLKGAHTGDLGGTYPFFQRNIGNSLMQSVFQGPRLSEGRKDGGSMTSTEGIFSRTASSSCCPSKSAAKAKLQPKLAVGHANDAFEQEADRVADQIIKMPDSSARSQDRMHVGINIQRTSEGSGNSPMSIPGNQLNKSGGRRLSVKTLGYMEPRFGMDFGHVRLHTNQQAHETAEQIEARAFTYGNHIWLGKGESENDKSLMAHELTHVLQQKTDSASPPMIRRTVAVNPNAAAANDILGQFRTICPEANFNRSGQTITTDASSVASRGCECLTDTAGDPDRTYTINVDTVANNPRNVTLHDGTTRSIPYPSSGPRTSLGTNPTIHMPSSAGSAIEFGAFSPAGAALWVPNWRVLAHELCGHGRLNQAQGGPKGNRPAHDSTIDTENTISGEHFEPARGMFADPRQGESFHNEAGNSSMIAFMLRDGWHYEAP